MAPILNDYFASLMNQGWQWGRFDCCMVLADWVLLVCGKDPAEGIRDTYHSELGCLDVVTAGGGLEALCTRQFEAVGCYPVNGYRSGDIGLIKVDIAGFAMGFGVTGALYDGRFWRIYRGRGFVASHFPVIKAWRIPCLSS